MNKQLLYAFALAVLCAGCSAASSGPVGVWQAVYGDDRIEIFSDNRASFETWRGTTVGDWTTLDDGRLKIEGVSEAPLLGRLVGDTLTFDGDRLPDQFVRLSPGADTISVSDRAQTRIMKADLRNFVTAQEAFFADNNRYAREGEIGTRQYLPSPGVTVRTTASNDSSFAGTAEAFGTAVKCRIEVGGGSRNDGEPICARSATSERP